MGQYEGKAAMFKFDKKNADMEWLLQVNLNHNLNSPNSKMNDIVSYVAPVNHEFIYTCGYAYVDATTESSNQKAVIMKVNDEGQVQYMYSWGQGLAN